MLYDLIIVGAGPAGMTAAIYAARRKINFLLISMSLGGQMAWSLDVENYPGTIHSSGIELTKRFQEHMGKYGIKVNQEEIVNISKKKGVCIVKTNKNSYNSKAVIIASGKTPRKLNVPGEDKFFGMGVNYCSTCDAPLYKEKKVAVIGGGNSGLEASLFLLKYAKKIYILESMPELIGEPYLRNRLLKEKKVEIITGANVEEILGNEFVSSIRYKKDGEDYALKIDGVFIEIGLISKTNFTNVKKNEHGEIIISRDTKSLMENVTSVQGIFAAGDASDVPMKQMVIAAGEGAKAALSSFNYINKWDKKKK